MSILTLISFNKFMRGSRWGRKFLSNTYPDPLKIIKLPSLHSTHISSDFAQNEIFRAKVSNGGINSCEDPKWCFAGGPLMASYNLPNWIISFIFSINPELININGFVHWNGVSPMRFCCHLPNWIFTLIFSINPEVINVNVSVCVMGRREVGYTACRNTQCSTNCK